MMINDSQSFSDDSIRRFLLGQLQATEQSTFEEQLFLNSELEARVRLAELELADDYAFKRLNPREIESFRERYLSTTSRHQQVAVSQAIRARLELATVPELKGSIYQQLKSFLDIRRPELRYAFAAVILILILATVVLVTKEPQIVRRIVPERFKPRPSPTATPQETNHVRSSSSPAAHDEQSPLEPPHESPQILALSSNTAIDQAPVLTAPANQNSVVRFQLAVKENGSYRADLIDSSGQTLSSAETLKSNGQPPAIDFDVQANSLKTGQYQIRVIRSDGQSSSPVYQYYFRVQ